MVKGLAQRYIYSKFERDREIDEISIHLPEPPPEDEIDGYGLPKEDQKFTPPDKTYIRELSYKISNEIERSQDELDFIDLQWDRREVGYWFYNNGNLEYITGLHYYYLTAWNIVRVEDVERRDGTMGKRKVSGLPTFTDSDRDYFYIWNSTSMDANCFGLIHITNRRDGKALDINTKIPTPKGWSTMGELKEGDFVFDSKGLPTLVTYVTEFQYERKCYQINFSDNTHIIADEDHQWIAYNKVSRHNINHPSWKAHKRIVSTKDMIDKITVGKNESNWSIETCLPVKYNSKSLEIPSYILGLWLGDGTSSRSDLTSVDQQIVDSWTEYAESLDLKISVASSITYKAVLKKRVGNQLNPLKEKLDKIKVLNNKHIPKKYLQSSMSDRIDLLQGMMDTDGCVMSNRRTFEYCSKSNLLIKDFKELVESLGFKSTLTTKFNKKYKKTYFYVRFGFQGEIMPFKLTRKIDSVVRERSGGWRTNHRYIRSIVPVDSRPVKCITVDSEDSSYLCGENFIITHNTYRATATINELISRSPDSFGGIQSKTDTDGAKIFKKLIKSWKSLPEYFKPVDVGESDPGKRLEYRNPKKRSTKTQKKEYSEVLDSEINYGNAKEEYYDGDGLLIKFDDEVGKTEPRVADIHERYYISRECLADGADVTGKYLLTTTVEDMEKKGGKYCKKLWDESTIDSDSYRKTKQTESGIKRYFKPAYYGLRGSDKSEDGDETPTFIDEYGYSDIVKAEEYLIKIEKTLSGEKLISRRRKYPRNIKDAFMLSGKSDVFPSFKIIQQQDYNETLNDSIVRRGDFEWKDKSKNEVEFFDNPKGFTEISWQPNSDEQNKCFLDQRGFYAPGNIADGVIGVDPYDHKDTVDNKKSDAAGSYFKRFNINSPLTSNGFVMHYVGRRVNPDDFYDDMVKAAVFFGVQVLCENQKPGLINHMNREGYKNYIFTTKQSDYTKSSSKKRVEGVSMAGNMVRQQAINGLVSYIYKFIGDISPEIQKSEFGWTDDEIMDNLHGHCPFESMLKDWIDFDANNWTVSDETVSSMIALLGVTPVRKSKDEPKENDVSMKLDSFFKRHKLR